MSDRPGPDDPSRPLRMCLVGATGLIGAQVIASAAAHSDMRVIAVARREVDAPAGGPVDAVAAPPAAWGEAIAAARAAVLVCALGTTWRKAGRDEAAMRAVDFDLVLACARAGKAAGTDHMIVVSSVGADADSRTLYLRIKGEMEQALRGVGFRRLDVLRPGLLRGDRREWRLGEAAASVLSPLVDPLLSGTLRRFRSVRAEALVDAIMALSREHAPGFYVHEYDSLRSAARSCALPGRR